MTSFLRFLSPAMLGLGLLSAATPSAFAAGFGPISDFMTMDVCVGADGRPVAGIPGDGACKRHRDIKPGEAPSYTLQNFASPRANCPNGPIAKVNVPVIKDGNTRIVSSTIRQPACGKPGPTGGGDDDGNQNGASIQWFDQGYGFIMGSYSPVALSTFESDRCLTNSNSSQRFFRGWVIGPAEVPALGASGYGIFPSKLKTGKAATLMGGCADRYNRALTTWSVNDVTFKSNRKLVSIVADHYAQGAPDGQTPGDAKQVERTYWTREFGLSRWEKWAREDWVHPRAKKTAPELAQALFAAGRCSAPMSQPVAFNKSMQVIPSQTTDGAYSKVILNPATGEQHTWYMTLCEDYTNAAESPDASRYSGMLAGLADDTYWK
ncbi:hypothetical protein BJF93_06250 [Xaviernesmea oryzae]|uniref:Uncharacterized protein n=1 Tax=Xaviernesmea oryzae TaxID=464029 RepID=A0A1Q9AS05_9HYPH|nr:hypothetical protein [Xaviernesmea oryzae]OLP58222.1 hypothetical protein BJF93_06250 [Xaviernesmea oryzae]SEL46054.1 hypothetical protein SAMN04487976_108161 [Xaviernesmea oryzae]